MQINRRRFIQSFSIGLMGVVLFSIETQGAPKHNVRNIAKKITVQLQYPGTSGSGILLFRDQQTYFVLTAQHVIADTQANEEAYVVTYDQQSHHVEHQSTYLLSDIDAALIQFQSNRDYDIATVGDSHRLIETDSLYVSGFPLPGTAIQTSNFTITTGELTGKNVENRGYNLIYDNVTQPGMSGGPVLNEQGQVIGMHGLAEGERIQGIPVKAGLNLGIPIQSILPWLPLNIEVAAISTSGPPKSLAINENEDFEKFLSDLYTKMATLMQDRDPNGIFALLPIEKERYRYKRLSGQSQTYTAHVASVNQLYAKMRARGERWQNIQHKFDSIQYPSPSEAIVSYTRTGYGRAFLGLVQGTMRVQIMTRWEKIDGAWKIIESEEISIN